jgi:hypothetical protein
MPRLLIIAQNATGVSVITSLGVILLAGVAVVILALWIAVVLVRARRGVEDPDDAASERGLEALRHWRLVSRRPPTAPGSQSAVVAEFEPTGDSDPTTR